MKVNDALYIVDSRICNLHVELMLSFGKRCNHTGMMFKGIEDYIKFLNGLEILFETGEK